MRNRQGKLSIGSGRNDYPYEPDFILSTGVAGSLDDDLHSGDTIMGVWYHYHDVFCGKELVKGQVQGMPSTFTPLEVGINTEGDLCVRIGKS